MGASTIEIGGRELARVGLGTNRLTDTPENRAFLHEAVDAGLRFVDTAHIYADGDSERTIGAASPPEEVLIATKGGYHGGGTEKLLAELAESLERLGRDRIDLYYAHRLDPEVPVENTVEALGAEREAGRIGHLGLSEVSVEEIERARRVAPIAAVQNEYSLGRRKHEGVLDHCEAEGIAFVPFFPLRGGDEAALAEIADRHHATPNAIRVAWLLRRSPVMAPIPGTLSIEHLRENLAAPEIELSDEDFARLDAG
jgi:pyridoxine 4-dehydrogenase